MKTKKKLFLLDGFALIYRAYFAFSKNPRINSKGLNTSAVFGFVNTLNEVIKKEKPTHIAVVFDRPTPTKRHIEYPQYKAHREAMPEGISEALPYIDLLLEALNIPKLYKDGYEADDVIGTLAKKAELIGFKTYMMTSDKDFAQLVSENIFMYRPGNKWQPTSVWGIPEVLEKFDIQNVNQVIDFLAMTGDAADNIPGISGVGTKTAQKLLKKYGSIEELFQNSHELKGKIKDKVESSKDIGLLSKKLVTIITDVPIKFNELDLKYTAPNQKKLIDLFEELEFKTMLSKIAEINKRSQLKSDVIENTNAQFNLFTTESENKIVDSSLNQKYKFLTSKNDIVKIVNKILQKKKYSFELINDSNSIIGIAISYSQTNGFYFLLNNYSFEEIKILFSKTDIKAIGFNIKKTIKLLRQRKITLRNKLFDIQIAHYLLHPEKRNTLEIISETYLNKNIRNKQEFLGKGKSKKTFKEIKNELITDFSCDRSLALFNLYNHLKVNLESHSLSNLFYKIEMPLTKVLAKMELEGISIDVNMLKKYSAKLTSDLNLIENEINNHAGEKFNIASPKQLGEILFDKLKLTKKPKKTKSGQYSTSEETLLKLKNSHPIISEILTFRSIKKLLSTYVNTIPELVDRNTKRLHTTFNQSVASTGRLSSINPNIQNIPIRNKRGMKVREAFIAKNSEYLLLAADYSQIELRIMASLSSDLSMISAFNNNHDIHSATAAKVYGVQLQNVTKEMRSNAKSVNFGIIYGISPFGLSQNIGITRSEAKAIIANYFKEFPKIKEYMDWSINYAREKEYAKTIMGRKRYLKDINSKNAVIRSMAERNAINTPIQGSAADIIKVAMINIHEKLQEKNMKSKMLLQVHDELVFDAHKSELETLNSIVKSEMEGAAKLDVPLTVEIGLGTTWLEAH